MRTIEYQTILDRMLYHTMAGLSIADSVSELIEYALSIGADQDTNAVY